MTTDQLGEQIKEARRHYDRAEERALEIVHDAMIATYERITGKKLSDHAKERIWDEIRWNV